MGTWDTGPFDSDTAADWAFTVRDCTDADARRTLLEFTLRGALADIIDSGDGHYDTAYELPTHVQHGYAAAAFVTDAARQQCKHTNSPYARGVAGVAPYELLPPVQLPQPDRELVALAVSVLDVIAARLDPADEMATSYLVHVRDIRADLTSA